MNWSVESVWQPVRQMLSRIFVCVFEIEDDGEKNQEGKGMEMERRER